MTLLILNARLGSVGFDYGFDLFLVKPHGFHPLEYLIDTDPDSVVYKASGVGNYQLSNVLWINYASSM